MTSELLYYNDWASRVGSRSPDIVPHFARAIPVCSVCHQICDLQQQHADKPVLSEELELLQICLVWFKNVPFFVKHDEIILTSFSVVANWDLSEPTT